MRITSKISKEHPKVPKSTSVVVFVVVWVQARLLILVQKTADCFFGTVIEPVLHVVSDKNFNFRRGKYLNSSLNYQK